MPKKPAPSSHTCPTCGVEPGQVCVNKNGEMRSDFHEERRALCPSPLAISVRLRRALEKLSRTQDALTEAKQELVDLRKETRRLRRLLEGTDIGTIVSLRRRLAESESQVRRLKMEILD